MATKSIETVATGTRRLRAICALAACILLGLGIWRGAEVFTQPADTSAHLSEEQRALLHVIEPLAGTGNVRVTVFPTSQSTRDFLVLIDSLRNSPRSLAKDIEAILGSAAGFNATLGDTLTVREFPFVDGLAASPKATELAELGVLSILVFLLAWGAFAPPKQVVESSGRAKSKRTADDRPSRTRPVAVDLVSANDSKAVSAAKTATDDPAGTANVIRAWMRSPENKT